MSAVVEMQPHDQAVLAVVQARSLDENSTRELVDEVLTAASATPKLPIVLDLSRVRFAPSVALGALVKLTKQLQLGGRRFALVGIEPRMMDTIRVTNLHTILEIHDRFEDVLDGPPKH